jgi:hypothetical protein
VRRLRAAELSTQFQKFTDILQATHPEPGLSRAAVLRVVSEYAVNRHLEQVWIFSLIVADVW